MKNKFGILCMSLGAVLIVAALALFLMNQLEDKKAGVQAEEVVHELEETIEETLEDGSKEHLPDPYDPTMTEKEIDGHMYVGYLFIPALNRKLPVMSDWSYPKLRISPCRYTGSTKTDDMVVMAHNYARHFGQIKNLLAGDVVYFTDMDGIVTQYEVVMIDTLTPTDVEEMTAGDYDLTLFTCTYGGQSRVTVRCERLN